MDASEEVNGGFVDVVNQSEPASCTVCEAVDGLEAVRQFFVHFVDKNEIVNLEDVISDGIAGCNKTFPHDTGELSAICEDGQKIDRNRQQRPVLSFHMGFTRGYSLFPKTFIIETGSSRVDGLKKKLKSLNVMPIREKKNFRMC